MKVKRFEFLEQSLKKTNNYIRKLSQLMLVNTGDGQLYSVKFSHI